MSTSDASNGFNFNHTFVQSTPRSNFMFIPPPHPVELMIQTYAIPILAILGIFCNSLSFVIFTRTKLKKTSCASYLAAVCISDSGFLCTTLLLNLNVFDIYLVYKQGLCQVLTFGNHVFTFLSVWYLTAMTTEKAIGVYWPHKKSEICTVFRAKCVVIGLAILSLVCYHHMTWFYAPYKGYCLPLKREAVHYIQLADAAIVHIIPYIVIFVLSCLIAIRTWQYYKMSRSVEQRLNARRQAYCATQEKEFKTTPMTLAVLFVAVILGFPVGGHRLKEHLREPGMERPSMIASQMVLLCSFINAGIKFGVYFLSSRVFRRETIGLMSCGKKRRVRLSMNAEMQSVGMQTIPECSSNAILEGAV